MDSTDTEMYKASKRKRISKIREKWNKQKSQANRKIQTQQKNLKRESCKQKNKNCDKESNITQRNEMIGFKQEKNIIIIIICLTFWFYLDWATWLSCLLWVSFSIQFCLQDLPFDALCGNYQLIFEKKNFFPIKRKQELNNCFKPLILSTFTTAESRLKSDQKEKEK